LEYECVGFERVAGIFVGGWRVVVGGGSSGGWIGIFWIEIGEGGSGGIGVFRVGFGGGEEMLRGGKDWEGNGKKCHKCFKMDKR
ncbi:hypothetical protein, partial [Neisseria sicca]|uniref:hypothetical protein n=1 Tax=Neisseria sicca TaxID=490 RepID=UPI001C9A0AC7